MHDRDIMRTIRNSIDEDLPADTREAALGAAEAAWERVHGMTFTAGIRHIMLAIAEAVGEVRN